VRLARLHGTGHAMRDALRASEVWQEAVDSFSRWDQRPQFKLDA
jgi:hypothetical protein